MNKLSLRTLLLIIFLLTVGCQRLDSEAIEQESNSVVVIESTEQDELSYLTFYNHNLNKTEQLQLNYGSMGSFFDSAKVYDNIMYVIPKGLGSEKKSTIVLSIDLKTKQVTTYDLQLSSINSFDISENNVFGVNTLNGDSTIHSYQKKDGKIQELKFPKLYISKLVYHEQLLYAFVSKFESSGNTISFLYVIDTQKMAVKNIINISNYGMSQFGALFYNNNLYFTNLKKMNEIHKEIPSSYLCKYNTKTGELHAFDLKETNPSQIVQMNNQSLLIVHNDLVTGTGNKLSLFDLKTNKVKTYTMKHNICQVKVEDSNTLYATDGNNLYLYKYEKNKFMQKMKVNAKTKSDTSLYFYLSCIF